MVDTNIKCAHENIKNPMGIFKPPKSRIAPSSTENNTETHIKVTEITNMPMKSQSENKAINVSKCSSTNQHHYELPTILLTNLQSMGKPGKTDKTTELELVLDFNNIDIGVCTETWATDAVLECLEFNEYNMFHSIRNEFSRASGGLSIFVKNSIPANRLDVVIPNHLEVMYVSIRPKRLPRTVSNIIMCALYYPGSKSKYAPPQEDLISHVEESIQFFQTKYSRPLIVLLGDFNDLPIDDICETCSLEQVVKVPTRKDNTLDLILTNIDNDLYKDPITLPSIGNSDHLCVVYMPKEFVKHETTKKKIMIRKFKDSAIREFGSWITNHDWSLLFRIKCVNEKVQYFSMITWLMIDKYFPVQKIRFPVQTKNG